MVRTLSAAKKSTTMIDIIIHHNADPDGNFSGAIALKANPLAQTIGYNYEPEFDHIIEASRGKRVVMVDVSPKNWTDMHRLCEVAEYVVWIDHHATALRQMEEHRTAEKYVNFEPVFEYEKWGAARKTFEFFFPLAPMPEVVEMVAGYDVFRDYGTDTWTRYYYPFRFAVSKLNTPQKVLDAFHLDAHGEPMLGEFLAQGRAVAEYIEDENKALVNNPQLVKEVAFLVASNTYRVLAVNRGLFGDMFKSRDLSEFAFVVGYFREADGWKVSLRGAGKGYDLGAIAREFGGGGHRDAAGFSVKTFEALRGILEGLE